MGMAAGTITHAARFETSTGRPSRYPAEDPSPVSAVDVHNNLIPPEILETGRFPFLELPEATLNPQLFSCLEEPLIFL